MKLYKIVSIILPVLLVISFVIFVLLSSFFIITIHFLGWLDKYLIHWLGV